MENRLTEARIDKQKNSCRSQGMGDCSGGGARFPGYLGDGDGAGMTPDLDELLLSEPVVTQ